jgi:hypothetical protein
MKVLLTGGSGNLGQTLVPKLLDKGDTPVTLDVRAESRTGNHHTHHLHGQNVMIARRAANMAEDTKQQEEKYRKINWRLYQEQRGKDRPFDWAKIPEPLYVELFDIEISHSARFEEENQPSLFAKLQAKATDEEGRVKELSERVAGQLSTEGKKRSVVRALRAKARFESNRFINVFEKGEISRTGYRTAAFVCREGEGIGSLMHVSGSMLDYDRDHFAPYLAIDTYLPSELFHPIAQQN